MWHPTPHQLLKFWFGRKSILWYQSATPYEISSKSEYMYVTEI